jgi:hypothetical protein
MTKRLLLLALALLALSIGPRAQEAVTLTTPQVVTTAALHVGYVGIDLDNARIVAQIENATNTVVTVKTYDSTTVPTGATLLTALNRGNFTVNSMMKAVYARLQTDGVIPAGAIAGTPQ